MENLQNEKVDGQLNDYFPQKNLLSPFLSRVNNLIYFLFFVFSLLYLGQMGSPSGESRWGVLSVIACLLPLLGFMYLLKSGKDVIFIHVSRFQVIIALFFIWFSLSVLWSINFAGKVSNWLNYASWILLIFFFIYYAPKLEIHRVSRYFLLSAVAVAAVGFAQYFGFDGGIFKQVAPPASTFVNKNMATPMMVLFLPLFYYQILSNTSKKTAIVYTIGFWIILVYLIGAATRSSWVGAVISLIVTIPLVLRIQGIKELFNKNFIKNRILILFIGIALSIVTIVIHEYGPFPRMNVSVLSKLDSLIGDGVTKGSANIRLVLWQNALGMLADKPLLGVGIGSFDAEYPYYHDSFVKDIYYTDDPYMGGTHNDPLQFLSELGIVGFILCALIFMEIFYNLIQLLRYGKREFILFYLGCFTGLSGLVVDSLFNFPFHWPTYTFFSAVIFGVVHYHALHYLPDEKKIKNIFTMKYRNRVLTPVVGLIFFILTMFSGKFFYDKYQTYTEMTEAMVLAGQGQLIQAIPKSEQAAKNWPYSDIILFEASNMAYRGFLITRSQENYQRAVYLNDLAMGSFPYHFKLLEMKIQLALFSNNINEIRKAEQHIPTLIKVAPDKKLFGAYVTSVIVYNILGNADKVEFYYSKALQINSGDKKVIEMLDSMRNNSPGKK